uniref:Ankyrin repeat protein n=1 Tax=Trichogramma kaykai TaxID=54128 RepID=A0ABD2XNX1_9HYME
MNYNTIRLDTLKYLRDNINWEVKAKRHELFDEFYRVLNDWDGRLSDLQRIFWPEQIEILLSDTINRWKTEDNLLAPFISFLVQTGYKDKPKVDQDGKLIYRRRTPLLLAALVDINPLIGCELFKIYDRFDINYTDERYNYTHLRAACEWGCTEVVEKFLQAGQEPNILHADTGDSLLHFALRSPHTSPEMIATLLRHGVNPNVVDKRGPTAVHLISMAPEDSDLMQMLIDLTDYKHQPVRIHLQDKSGYTALQKAHYVWDWIHVPLHTACIEKHDVELAKILIKFGTSIDAQDIFGNTPLHNAVDYSDLSLVEFLLRNGADPYITNEAGYNALQYAVASLRPDLIDVFLDNVVDLSSFVFPTAKQFNESNAHWKCRRLELTSILLNIVERLEKRGYE